MFAMLRDPLRTFAFGVLLTLLAVFAIIAFGSGRALGQENDRPAPAGGDASLPVATTLTAGPGRTLAPQPTFVDSGQNLGGDAGSSAVALGDLDADGDLDAVVATSFGGPSKVYLNQGGDQSGTEGVFIDSGQSLTESEAADVELADLDGDTDLDAFFVKDAVGESNEVWLNQGVATGVFSQTNQIFGDDQSTSVALGDLDGVAGLDAFVGRFLGQPSKVWFNDGNGSFADSGQTLDNDSLDLALGDLDGDGDLDAFSANGAENKVWVNLGGEQDGEPGIFVESGQVLSNTLSLVISLGDVDGDADLDVYVGNDQADRLWINQGGSQGGTEGVFQDSGQSLSNSVVQTRDVSLGDLDSDGDLDAFLAKGGNEVWINQGGSQGGTEGVFQYSGQSLGNAASYGLALGDVDGDGDLDAFVANWGQPDKVWLNGGGGNGNGGGGLLGASDQDLDDYVYEDIALADLDGDGDLDAILESLDRDFHVWLNGEGGDPPGVFSLGQKDIKESGAAGLALGDVDGDGDVDVFAALYAHLAVFLNGEGDNPPGTLSPGQELAFEPTIDSAIALGDLDNDGDLDAFVTEDDPVADLSDPSGRVRIFLNGEGGDPAGTFSLEQTIEAGDTPPWRDVALGDVDGDGDLDAVSVGLEVSVFLNGSGTDPLAHFSLGQQMDILGISIALGDLDGDDDLDAYLTTPFQQSDRILLNGVVGNEGTFTDLGRELSTEHHTDVALGDLDDDGDLDAYLTTARNPLNGARSHHRLWDQVWENGGDNIPSQCLGNANSYAVALGDLDSDGDLDAFVATGGYWVTLGTPDSVWINGQGSTCSCVVRYMYELAESGAKSASSGDTDPSHADHLLPFLSLSTELQTYLDLRDYMLDRSSNGLHYARLFYNHNAEIYSLLIGDAALRDESLATLQLWQPDLQAMLDGQGGSVTIGVEQVQAVDDFLANLSVAASPELRQVIAEERAKLPPPEAFIGMALDEAQGIVLPDVTYLPAIHKP